jgi:hypothetical protein
VNYQNKLHTAHDTAISLDLRKIMSILPSWMPTYIDVVFPTISYGTMGSPHLFACLPWATTKIPIFPWPQISRNWRWFESVPWPAVKVTDGTHEMPWNIQKKTMDHWTIGFWATQSYPNLQSPISYAQDPKGRRRLWFSVEVETTYSSKPLWAW